MKYILTVISLLFASTAAADCVILVHGLARSSYSFLAMETALKSIGYDVVNVGYPSTESTIEELSELAIPPAVAVCKNARKMHFVTHSMGGIMVRYYLKHTV